MVLDPLEVTQEIGGQFNPLDLIRADAPEGVDEATAPVMALLPDSFDGSRNQFWVSRGRQLLLCIVLHVVSDLPEQDRTLAKVRELIHELTGDQQKVARRLSKSRHPEVRLIVGALSIGASISCAGLWCNSVWNARPSIWTLWCAAARSRSISCYRRTCCKAMAGCCGCGSAR